MRPRGRIETVMTALYPDGRRSELRFHVRLYTLSELARRFPAAGIPVVAHYGGLDGSPLTLESSRLVVMGRKDA